MALKRVKKQPTPRPVEGMGGLAKGLAIIEALATRGVQSSADAARASHSTRAAARRCLLTLVDLGYVERIGEERWRLVLPWPHFESKLDILELVAV